MAPETEGGVTSLTSHQTSTLSPADNSQLSSCHLWWGGSVKHNTHCVDCNRRLPLLNDSSFCQRWWTETCRPTHTLVVEGQKPETVPRLTWRLDSGLFFFFFYDPLDRGFLHCQAGRRVQWRVSVGLSDSGTSVPVSQWSWATMKGTAMAKKKKGPGSRPKMKESS